MAMTAASAPRQVPGRLKLDLQTSVDDDTLVLCPLLEFLDGFRHVTPATVFEFIVWQGETGIPLKEAVGPLRSDPSWDTSWSVTSWVVAGPKGKGAVVQHEDGAPASIESWDALLAWLGKTGAGEPLLHRVLVDRKAADLLDMPQVAHRYVDWRERLPEIVPDEARNLLMARLVLESDAPRFACYTVVSPGQRSVGSPKPIPVTWSPFVPDAVEPDPSLGGPGLGPDFPSIRRDSVRLTTDESATLSALARALAFARIGVALGGAGAASFRSRALLNQTRGLMPIDLMTGTSGGGLVGALEAIGSDSKTKGLTRALLKVLVTSNPKYFEDWLDKRVGDEVLEKLATPLYPLAVKLIAGAKPSLWLFPDGPVGRAVARSGAFPGILPPIIDQKKKPEDDTVLWVDGALDAYVPAVPLRGLGADYTLAISPLAIGYDEDAAKDQFPKLGVPVVRRVVHTQLALKVTAASFLHAARIYCDAFSTPLPAPGWSGLMEVFRFDRTERIATKWPGAETEAKRIAEDYEAFIGTK